jgi:tol-pal system protein YbgF
MAFLIRRIAIAAAILAAASPVFAQAPIVDLSNGNTRQQAPAYQTASRTAPAAERGRAQTNAQADAYYQMQVLQQEVQELRGAVEELRHEVKRLRQQRTEDYTDLDRRIARITGQAPSQLPENEGGDAPADVAPAPAAGSDSQASDDERDRYHASFELARKGDYSGASIQFKSLLQDYPEGQYAPNANYWLGEIALVQGNLEDARQWFVALLDSYPNSNKVWDGRYKLGTVYHQLGDNARAKELLQQVAGSDARAAGLAQQYLKDNF